MFLLPVCVRFETKSRLSFKPMSSLNPVLTIGTQVAEPMWLHQKKSWPCYRRSWGAAGKSSNSRRRTASGRLPASILRGMRQRVMIAMALACQPRLIIADEPTTALDVTVQAQILSLLKNLTKELGSSLILITHDLGVVARYADRVAVMYGGRIVETASARDLYKNPQHPYTKGLMASIPKLDGDPGSRLFAIEGRTTDLSDLPIGCAFHPRCPHTHQSCRAGKPPLSDVAPNHKRVVSVMTNSNILEVEDLKVHFPITEGLLKRQVGSIAAVDGVSFHIKRGETYSRGEWCQVNNGPFSSRYAIYLIGTDHIRWRRHYRLEWSTNAAHQAQNANGISRSLRFTES